MKMEDLVNYCKQYGFIYQGSEIYGGLANTWDYGPLGSRLKNNVKDAWRKRFIQERPNAYELDADILMHPRVWEASGHVDSFADPLTGYKEEIIETGRKVDKKIILNDDEKSFINQELLKIQENINVKPEILITYFVKDKLKDGGKYLTLKNYIKRIDLDNKKIIMIDNFKIDFDNILKIEILKNEEF